MANTADEKISLGADLPGEPVSPVMQVIVPALGWLIPGAGHLLLKRWVRGGLLLVSIVAMFLIGLAMEGHVYHPNGGDILDMLGFVGDVGAGALYILSTALGWGPGAIEHATADYGTKFL